MSALEGIKFEKVFHFAAESHVDNSISGPEPFIFSNIMGTYNLNEFYRDKDAFFLHVSTDEVYGDLSMEEEPFSETTRYNPSSPYSASKAASDHLVKSWVRTFKLPAIIVNCTNNYGPNQYIEKLIPKTITSALNGKQIAVYGNGTNIREWIYVEDFCRAILAVSEKGIIGETYNIGSGNELNNLEIIELICKILAEKTNVAFEDYKKLITMVDDRPGHDFRYAVNSKKIKDLGWDVTKDIVAGLNETIDFFIERQ